MTPLEHILYLGVLPVVWIVVAHWVFPAWGKTAEQTNGVSDDQP